MGFSFFLPLFTAFLSFLVPPLKIAAYPFNACQQYSGLFIFTTLWLLALALVPRAKGPSRLRHRYRQLPPTRHRPFFSLLGCAVRGIRVLPEIFTWICASPFFPTFQPPASSHSFVYPLCIKKKTKKKRRTPKNTEVRVTHIKYE